MKNKYIFLVLIIFTLVGCSKENIEETEKSEYIALKSNLLKNKEFDSNDDLPCNITVSLDRVNDEEVSYRVILDDALVNMKDIKALVVHNYYTEDIFPSIGLFDDSVSLLVGDENVKGVELVGYVKTTKDIDELNLELKIWIEYTDDNGEKKEIYYKTT